MKNVITTLAIDVNKEDSIYKERSKKLINSVLSLTNLDLIVVTDSVEYFKNFKNERLKICLLKDLTERPFFYRNTFNYSLKKESIKKGYNLEYDNVIYCDCDMYFTRWDTKKFNELLKEDYDIIAYGSGIFKDFIEYNYTKVKKDILKSVWKKEFYNVSRFAETFFILKNNTKTKYFLQYWDKLSKLYDIEHSRTENSNITSFFEWIEIGISIYEAKMKVINLLEYEYRLNYEKFTEGWEIQHGFGNDYRVLNFYGHTVQ